MMVIVTWKSKKIRSSWWGEEDRKHRRIQRNK